MQYLTLFWKGDRRSQEWHDILTVGQSADLALQHAHDTQGYGGVCNVLDTNDSVETWLARIGAEVVFQTTGDKEIMR